MKKNYKWKSEKKIFSWFFIILHISQNPILGVKNKFSPFFSAISSPIGLKIFLVRLQVIWVGRFFFLDTFYQSSLAGFAKFLGSKKPRDFAKCSVFWFSSLKYLEFLKKKKRSPRLGPSTHSKNFSSNGWNLWNCGVGKLFAIFWPWDLWKSMKMMSIKICVYDNFCSTTRGLSTLKVSGICVRPFLRNAGKGGGGPLKPMKWKFLALDYFTN